MRKTSVFSFQFKTIALVSSTALIATTSLQALSNNFKNISLKESISSFLDAGAKVINGVLGLGAGSSLLYGSVYSAGETFYSVGSFATEKIKNTAEKSYNSINNGITWSTGNFSKATEFLTKGYTGIKTALPSILNAIWSGVKYILEWSQKNWNTLIFEKIKQYLNLSKLKENLGLDNGNWKKVKNGFSDFFQNFKNSPLQTVRDTISNMYRVVFKFVAPWGWSFLSVGIFEGISYAKLWKRITEEQKFKETLVEVMKFFKKFQVTLELMEQSTRDEIIKLFLNDPDKFFEKIKLLNESGNEKAASDVLHLKASKLKELLNSDPAELKRKLTITSITSKVVEGIGTSIGEAAGKAIGSVEKIFNGDSVTDSSIEQPVKKIITEAASAVSDVFGSIISSGFSLFGGNSKKTEASN